MLPVTTTRAVLTLTVSALLGLTLAGCSSSSSADSSSAAASSAAASVAPSGSVAAAPSGSAAPSSAATGSAAPSVAADPAAAWCSQYGAIATVLTNATATTADAQKALDVIPQFTQLWADGVAQGFVSAEETAANNRAITAYEALIKLFVAGKAADSPEVTAAGADLTAITTKDKALLDSTDKKVVALCAPAGASTGASAAASPAAS